MKNLYATIILFLSFFAISAQNKTASESMKGYEGRVGLYKRRNVFFINNTPYPPIMYSGTE